MQYFLICTNKTFSCSVVVLSSFPTVVIGFEETIYIVNEEVGAVVVYVALLDGTLASSG